MRHIFEVDIFQQVSIFDAILGARSLMLMVEIFAELGEAHSSEALLIERIVIASAQEAVEAKDQHRLDSGVVGAADVGDVAGQFAGWSVVLSAEGSNPLDVSI